MIKHKTAKDRFTRAVKSLNEWCRDHRHAPIPMQHRVLSQKLRGHFAYFGVPGNARALARFWYEAICIWRKWLDQRSQRRSMPWHRMNRLRARYPLPPPHINPSHGVT